MGNQPTDFYGGLDDADSQFASAPSGAFLPPEFTSTTAQIEIPPVRLRPNARVGTLNHGVYASWDREPEGERGSLSGSLPRGSLPKQKYESLDLMKLLYDTDGEMRGSASLDADLMMGMDGGKETSLATMDSGF